MFKANFKQNGAENKYIIEDKNILIQQEVIKVGAYTM